MKITGINGILDNIRGASAIKLSATEDFSELWGVCVIVLSNKDIAALASGEICWFNDGEYAHIILSEDRFNAEQTQGVSS